MYIMSDREKIMQHLTRQLIHLVAVVDYGSLSAAAAALNLTQPALSRSIRYLESEIEGKLLDRGRGGATPTRLGELVYIHGKNILASLDRVADDVQAWHRHDAGHLIVGSTSLPAAHFVPAAIASFLDEKPKVGLRFEVRPMDELMSLLRQGAIDLFVGGLSVEGPPAEIETTVLIDERLAVISGPQHPLARTRNLNIEKLSDYPWMLSPKGTELRQQADATFLDMGLTNVDVAIETVATVALMPLLAQGNYLTLHSKYLLAPDIKSGNLVVVTENVPAPQRSLAAFHRPKNEMTALIHEFVGHLSGYAKTF